MTVQELIFLLETFPEDSSVEFYGYAAGHDFYQKLEPRDVILEKVNNNFVVVLKADWN